jgi:CheY-like chemotaxis protein
VLSKCLKSTFYNSPECFGLPFSRANDQLDTRNDNKLNIVSARAKNAKLNFIIIPVSNVASFYINTLIYKKGVSMNTVEHVDGIRVSTGKDIKTILVVDDESDNRQILSALLGKLGYAVIDEADGTSALSRIRKGAKIDLVLTDERMPDMSGLELIETLRREVPSLPVILITAFGSIQHYLRSSSLGVFEYVNRPVGKRELGMIVKAALQDSEIN